MPSSQISTDFYMVKRNSITTILAADVLVILEEKALLQSIKCSAFAQTFVSKSSHCPTQARSWNSRMFDISKWFPLLFMEIMKRLPKPCDQTMHWTHIDQEHQECSAGVHLVSTLPEMANCPYESYTGQDSVSWYLEKLRHLEEKCIKIFFDPKRLKMEEADKRAFAKAKISYLCNKKFESDKPNRIKVRDHDHVTAKYRGAHIQIVISNWDKHTKSQSFFTI